MKEFFKYGAGYINLDDENLYLTSSGNWQEARELKEKDKSGRKGNNRRIGRNAIFLNTVLTFAGIAIVTMIESNQIKYGLLLGIVFLIYQLDKYFSQEMGYRYKIPLAKIIIIEKI